MSVASVVAQNKDIVSSDSTAGSSSSTALMVERRNHPRLRQEFGGLLRRTALFDRKRKCALFVESQRVHTVNKDLA